VDAYKRHDKVEERDVNTKDMIRLRNVMLTKTSFATFDTSSVTTVTCEDGSLTGMFR
jgi:hypothetical protein